MSRKCINTVTYEEEDGYEITRDEDTILVYGTAEADYSYYYSLGRMYMPNGDPGYPDESELERVSDMDCEITEICDADGNKIDTELTDAEKKEFEDYMDSKLEDAAEDHEFEDDPPDPEDI